MNTLEWTTEEHIKMLAENMRDEDVKEVMLSHGHSPEEAVRYSVEMSEKCVTVFHNGQVALITGICRPKPCSLECSIWMLSTPVILDIKVAFLKHSKKVVEYFLKGNSKLYNYVWEGNLTSKYWLKWIGFKLSDAQPYGVEGNNFHYFEMVADNV